MLQTRSCCHANQVVQRRRVILFALAVIYIKRQKSHLEVSSEI